MMVVGIGQCSWDYLGIIGRYPPPDTKEEILGHAEQGGGPVATALVALRRLGAEGRFHGIVGDDPEGALIRASLDSEGVDATGLICRPGADSQVAHIMIERATGRRTIFWRRPTGEALGPDELPAGYLDGADMLMLDGLMAGVSMHAAREARARGIPVMIDAGRVREGMTGLAGLADYLVGSEEFARGMGFEGIEGAADFFERHEGITPGVFTITLGASGSLTYAAGRLLYEPAYQIQVVDTTGAGDVFHAGYAYGVLSGWELGRALRFATVFAALKCRGLGGRAGIPGLEDVLPHL